MPRRTVDKQPWKINVPADIIEMMRESVSVKPRSNKGYPVSTKVRKTYHLEAETPPALEALLEEFCVTHGLDRKAMSMGTFADFVITCGMAAIREGTVEVTVIEQTVRRLKV